MYYEINISLQGRHFFATHKRSITNKAELDAVLPVLRSKFPASEGFQVDVTRYETHGYVETLT